MRSALARMSNAARPVGAGERELPFELVLEQPLDDLAALLDLERKRALGEARTRRPIRAGACARARGPTSGSVASCASATVSNSASASATFSVVMAPRPDALPLA